MLNNGFMTEPMLVGEQEHGGIDIPGTRSVIQNRQLLSKFE